MYYNETCAAKGAHGSSSRHLLYRSMERAAVNIYRTENSFEMLVFAPGRIREHFGVDLAGGELTVSYKPPEGFPRPEWIRREYSRGGFTRNFSLGAAIDGHLNPGLDEGEVLHIHLPLLKGEVAEKQKINVQ